ncbi:hypothetical protein KIN20_011939 [Parelaphostrongylus tenuis]|uniref:Thioredoxin domain-containing protein n=1 Tax=Parelaphostrongylus tenuis TaxID=148309 RepID=A0AAD5QQ67_PARTN|nr:hypothetical protein KIN20_011939 [Parelaphostrongylus tenuis]
MQHFLNGRRFESFNEGDKAFQHFFEPDCYLEQIRNLSERCKKPWTMKLFFLSHASKKRMWDTVLYVLLPCLHSTVAVDAADNLTILTKENINSTLSKHQLVFTMFGVNWCPHTNRLRPLFNEAAEIFKQNHPSSDVIWAKVDCEAQSSLCKRYSVHGYPTVRVFIHGVVMDGEYRGKRDVPHLIAYVVKQYTGPIREFKDDLDLETKLNRSSCNVVAYIQRGGEPYKNLFTIAELLGKHCTIWMLEEKLAQNLTKFHIYFKAQGKVRSDFAGDLDDYMALKQWMAVECLSLVKEVTFENVDSITEEGRPLLVYFRDPEKNKEDQMFIDVVIRELLEERLSINALLADGFKFVHPLQHLGKTVDDLPVLAIDSLIHMYLFPNVSLLSQPGALKQFVNDLHSENLHKRFHETAKQRRDELEKFRKKLNIQHDLEDRREELEHNDTGLFKAATSESADNAKLESVFKNFKKQGKRYSLLQRTEL